MGLEHQHAEEVPECHSNLLGALRLFGKALFSEGLDTVLHSAKASFAESLRRAVQVVYTPYMLDIRSRELHVGREEDRCKLRQRNGCLAGAFESVQQVRLGTPSYPEGMDGLGRR